MTSYIIITASLVALLIAPMSFVRLGRRSPPDYRKWTIAMVVLGVPARGIVFTRFGTA